MTVEPMPAPAPPAGLLAHMAGVWPTSARARRALIAYGIGEMGWKAAKAWRAKLAERRQFTVAVEENDDIYPLLHRWLLDTIPHVERRALTVRTDRRDGLVGPDGSSDDGGLRVFYDGSRQQSVTVGGHTVGVAIERDTGRLDLGGGDSMSFGMGRARMVFTATSPAGREAVLAFVDEVVKESRRSAPRLRIANRWGDWHNRSDLPPRRLDTVVLRDGLADELVADLDWFLQAERDYAQLGLPWHRGYLFHGPPGTGKTSVARALATRFGIDVYYVPLSDLSDDTQLLNMFAQVGPRSMLLLEDIDVVHAAKARDDETARKQVSLSGLLNALDGVATPHGLVTVMTTNDISVLDEALIRPGRADKRVELGYLDGDQLARLVDLMLGYRPAWLADIDPTGMALAPADIIEAVGPPGSRPDGEDRLRRLFSPSDDTREGSLTSSRS